MSESAIDREAGEGIRNVATKTRGTKPCPFCRNVNWYAMGWSGNPSLLTFDFGQIPTYVLACTNCGFLRMHVSAVVDDEVQGEVSFAVGTK